MSADNQQERLKTLGWIVGFVDGEGTFSLSVFRNKTSKLGWQVFPEFVITQRENGLKALQEAKQFFDCGQIYVNRRFDNHRVPIYRYCVRNIKDLRNKIVPVFQRFPLKTSKKTDFNLFSEALDLMDAKKHLASQGIKLLAEIAERMNRKKRSAFLGSSETLRQTTYS